MRALLLAVALSIPQLGQQVCWWDCAPGTAFWERQAQQDTQDRLRQLELERQVRQYQNWDQPRGTDPMDRDFPFRGSLPSCRNPIPGWC